MARLRVVPNANVLVSGIAYPGSIPGKIIGTWRAGGIDIVPSRHIIDEMIRVLPRLSRNPLGPDDIRDLADSFTSWPILSSQTVPATRICAISPISQCSQR
ncbi:hypothetical protein [Hankyongella ginsenosidimutans]|uniref:hypothetical protein n=1 Tax=Hankyongella ginsenosidimutans TaxID=1763828 RepID=UPI001CA37211|nr:hypothetical protein [Hankyongella ginsenosidimutans]